MIQETPDEFKNARINTVYPPNNFIEFEWWLYGSEVFAEKYTDRIFLPIKWTAYYVNNNYGNDKAAINRLKDFLYTLDTMKRYWTCVQYDDGILNDVSHLDLLQFNMSKNIGVPIPLIGQPHPYKFSGEKKYVANFIGSRTHQIRNELEKFKGKEGWYISFEPHDIETYCRIISESIFTICPRGYGLNSFRITEALQYNSIPIYLSDEFIVPFDNNFYYGMRCLPTDDLVISLETVPDNQVAKWMESLPEAYNKYYTYEGCFNQIIKSLETEYNLREQVGKKAELDRDAEESGAWRF